MCHVCPSWLSFILYNPVRKRFTDRGKIICESGIAEDSVVLEVGAGNGFLTEAIAARAKKVIVVELQDGMVGKLKKRLSGSAGNVDIITADISSWSVQAGIADVCLLYYCFHEFADQPGAVANLARAVRSGGTVSIYEPRVEVGKEGMNKMIQMFTEAGFVHDRAHHTIFTWFVRLRKGDSHI